MVRVYCVVNAAAAVVVGVGAVFWLLCGVALVVVHVRNELEKRREKR